MIFHFNNESTVKSTFVITKCNCKVVIYTKIIQRWTVLMKRDSKNNIQPVAQGPPTPIETLYVQ